MVVLLDVPAYATYQAAVAAARRTSASGAEGKAASHPLQAQEAVLFAYFADRIAFYSKSAEALGIVGNTNP